MWDDRLGHRPSGSIHPPHRDAANIRHIPQTGIVRRRKVWYNERNVLRNTEGHSMRLISWNVNGLRACLNKGFLDFCTLADADVICLQETKMRPEQASFALEGYHRFWNSADKSGYSGTAVFTRRQPLSVTYDFGDDVHRHEGRVITAEFEDFYLVCCYTPNSKDQLARLDYRMAWEDDIRAHVVCAHEAGNQLPAAALALFRRLLRMP